MTSRICAFAVNLFTRGGRGARNGVIVCGSVLSCIFYPDLLLILSYLQVIGQSAAGRNFTAVTLVMDVFISIYALEPFCDFPRWKRNLSNRLQNLLAKTDSSDTFGITLFPLAVMDKLILLEPYPWLLFCGGRTIREEWKWLWAAGAGKGLRRFLGCRNVLFLSLLIFPTRWRGVMTYLAVLRG